MYTSILGLACGALPADTNIYALITLNVAGGCTGRVVVTST